jgi:hypothetical protein
LFFVLRKGAEADCKVFTTVKKSGRKKKVVTLEDAFEWGEA